MTRHKSWVWGQTKIRSRCHKPHYICGDTISVGTQHWAALPTRNDRPKLQSAPATPRTVGARYNQKSIGLALRLREC